MGMHKEIKAQDIISANYVIKFFDDECWAENLFSTGEMLFRPIKSFIKSKQPGRSDSNEGKVNCNFKLYFKGGDAASYKKFGDVTAVQFDVNRPIYSYYRLCGRNFDPNGAIYLNPKMLKDFSSGKQPFCAILDRDLYEKKVMDFFKDHDIAVSIGNVNYSDEAVDSGTIMQMLSGKSDLAYFRKSKEYEEQQERRIVLGEHIDSLVKRGIGRSHDGGIIINIGSLSDIGYIGMPVNFY